MSASLAVKDRIEEAKARLQRVLVELDEEDDLESAQVLARIARQDLEELEAQICREKEQRAEPHTF